MRADPSGPESLGRLGHSATVPAVPAPPNSGPTAPPYVACVDIGSTWTKAALVSASGQLLATSSHLTTPPEVLDGLGAAVAGLATGPGTATDAPVLACSSAGGGLRLAVVGQEPLVSAEAGRRVALSAGAQVVHVQAGAMAGPDLRRLRASRPDVVLLVGGTDGGDARTLLHNAARLAANRIAVPVVVAGNSGASQEAQALLRSTGRTTVATANVLPDIGELNPAPAREAIRAVFLDHVIGGKGLSRGPRLRRLVRLVTPDAVLVGVGRLATVLAGEPQPAGADGAVLVVDVGGATTDVYSAVSEPDPSAERHAVALPPQRRTVEGDLGLRWSAPGLVAEAVAERLVAGADAAALGAAAHYRADHPGWVPTPSGPVAGPDDPTGGAITDLRLAVLATVLAVRRHLRLIEGNLGPRGAGLLVLSGGVFRHTSAEGLAWAVAELRADPVLRPVLRHATVRVDADHLLAPAGLLVHNGHAPVAGLLLRRLAA